MLSLKENEIPSGVFLFGGASCAVGYLAHPG